MLGEGYNSVICHSLEIKKNSIIPIITSAKVEFIIYYNQIIYLRKRISLIRLIQIFGATSILLCIISMVFIYLDLFNHPI